MNRHFRKGQEFAESVITEEIIKNIEQLAANIVLQSDRLSLITCSNVRQGFQF